MLFFIFVITKIILLFQLSSYWHDLLSNFNFKVFLCFYFIPAIAPCTFFYFLFYITVQFLIVNLFIWKSYVKFSFIEFIFVMVKDTFYLLTYLYRSFCRQQYYHFLYFLNKMICRNSSSAFQCSTVMFANHKDCSFD